MIVVRISGRSWREPVLNLTSRKPNEQVRWLILGVATPLLHLPLGQKTSNRCCVLWMVGVWRAVQLSHLHSIEHADSEEPPPTSELSGWLVLGVELQLKTLSLRNLHRLLSNRCTGPAELQSFLYFLNHGILSLQELVKKIAVQAS